MWHQHSVEIITSFFNNSLACIVEYSDLHSIITYLHEHLDMTHKEIYYYVGF